MKTRGRPKSTNIEDRRGETKRTTKTNNNNNSSGLIPSRNQKGSGKADTFITSAPFDMGNWRPRPNKPLQLDNGDSPQRGSDGKANRNTFRNGR